MIMLKKNIQYFLLYLFIAAFTCMMTMSGVFAADEKNEKPADIKYVVKAETETKIVKIPELKKPIISNGDFEKHVNDDKWPDDWGKGSGVSWESEDPDA
jgi:hypothetical protein